MTEHTPMDPFETRLAGLVRAYTAPAVHPVHPYITARTAISTSTQGITRRRWPVTVDRRLFRTLVVAAIVVALTGLAVAVGSLLTPHDPGRIVFVRDGDLFVAEVDGSGQTRIAEGSADDTRLGYLTALWAPDGRHIAAVRDTGGEFLTPAVDILTSDGAAVRTVALDAGCGPSLSWSPDSSEVAIATCPADVPRNAIEPVESGIRLLLAGLDASADREIALPAEWQSVASANPEVWIRPDLWAQWSPDGRWIALWAIVGGQPGQYLVATDGSGTQRIEELTDNLGDSVGQLDWSPAGRSLAIAGDWVGCEGALCLGVVGIEGGPLTASFEPPSVDLGPNGGSGPLHEKLFWPEVSPDGARIAVHSLTFDTETPGPEVWGLHVYDVATGRHIQVASSSVTRTVPETVTGELVEMGTVHWTPDGRRLLYLVRESGEPNARWTIRSADAAGGGPSSALVEGVQSFDLGDGEGGTDRREPDQTPTEAARLVFVRDGDIYVAEEDGRRQTRIAQSTAEDAGIVYLPAIWSPDMRHIAAVRD